MIGSFPCTEVGCHLGRPTANASCPDGRLPRSSLTVPLSTPTMWQVVAPPGMGSRGDVTVLTRAVEMASWPVSTQRLDRTLQQRPFPIAKSTLVASRRREGWQAPVHRAEGLDSRTVGLRLGSAASAAFRGLHGNARRRSATLAGPVRSRQDRPAVCGQSFGNCRPRTVTRTPR